MTQPLATTLKFGTKEFVIRRTTLRQLEEIETAFAKTGSGSMVGLAKSIVRIGLSRDDSNVVLDEIEATPMELRTAMEQVLALAGFDALKPGAPLLNAADAA